MTPREIIAEAWTVTQREKSLRRWGFTSSFFETLLNLKLISYQVYFIYEAFAGQPSGFFDVEINIYNHLPHWFFWTFLILLLILFVVEFFVPKLATGAIIGLAAKSHNQEPVTGGLVLALYNFFPIFAVHETLILSSWATTITLCSVIARYIEGNIKFGMIGVVVGLWIFSNILGFFFSFAEPAIVIQKIGPFQAMGRSFKLIVSYLGRVMFLLLLLFVISLRVFLNAIIVLVIPGIVIGLAILFAHFLSPVISYSIAVGIGVVLVFIASYFFAYLHVFREAVWTITFIELQKHKDLDVIGNEQI